MSQSSASSELHIQLYDQGICVPLLETNRYSTSRYYKSKSVFQSGAYYSTIYVYVNSLDSGDLKPQTNHQLQCGSLQFNSSLDYELVLLKYDGFNKSSPDSMVIHISKLAEDAQLILPFKKGKQSLERMKYFNTLKKKNSPKFAPENDKRLTNQLKLDSTTYFANGGIKTKYFKVADNFPLYYMQEFDSINPSQIAQGFRLLSYYKKGQEMPLAQSSIWTNNTNSKYGYWEYFERDKRFKHELWAGTLQQKFEWYPSGQLKFASFSGHSKQDMKHVYYLEDGKVKEEFFTQTNTRRSAIKEYSYSKKGDLILVETYDSLNGITRQGLQKRELYYPTGSLKMEENFIGVYSIKKYNPDGTERVN